MCSALVVVQICGFLVFRLAKTQYLEGFIGLNCLPLIQLSIFSVFSSIIKLVYSNVSLSSNAVLLATWHQFQPNVESEVRSRLQLGLLISAILINQGCSIIDLYLCMYISKGSYLERIYALHYLIKLGIMSVNRPFCKNCFPSFCFHSKSINFMNSKPNKRNYFI